MPKQRINRNEILDVAMNMTREAGYEQVNARSIAMALNSSVQPIYSYFLNMDELKNAVYMQAMEFYHKFIYARVDNKRMIESMSKANIIFAKEEPNLFRLLFLTKLKDLNSFSDIYNRMGDQAATEQLCNHCDVSHDAAKEIYTMMMIFTHGIAALIATAGMDAADAEIDMITEKAYKGFVSTHKDKQKE